MRVSLRVTILLLFLSYIRHVESKLYTRSDAISSSAPILSSYSFFGVFTSGPFLAMQLALVVIECIVVTTLFVVQGRDLHKQLTTVRHGEAMRRKAKNNAKNVVKREPSTMMKKLSRKIRTVMAFSMRLQKRNKAPDVLSQTERFHTLLMRCMVCLVSLTLISSLTNTKPNFRYSTFACWWE